MRLLATEVWWYEITRSAVFLTSTEDLQNFEWLIVTEVLDEVTHVARHNANVASHVVEGTCIAFCGEDGDSGTTFDEE
jgi:hypothetical protein